MVEGTHRSQPARSLHAYNDHPVRFPTSDGVLVKGCSHQILLTKGILKHQSVGVLPEPGARIVDSKLDDNGLKNYPPLIPVRAEQKKTKHDTSSFTIVSTNRQSRRILKGMRHLNPMGLHSRWTI